MQSHSITFSALFRQLNIWTVVSVSRLNSCSYRQAPKSIHSIILPPGRVNTHGPMNLKWVLLKPVYSRGIDVQTPAKSQPTLLIKLSQNYPIARNVTSLGWTVSWNNANSAQLYWFLGLACQIKLSWGLVGGGWQAGNNQVQNKSQFRWTRLNQPTGTKLGKMEICFRQTSHFERINRFWKQIGLYTQLRISIRFNNMYSIGWGGTVPNQRVKLS